MMTATKILSTFIFILLLAIGNLLGQCVSAAGEWVDDSNFQWDLTQDAQGTITGTVTVSAVCQNPWPVSGDFLGNGNFKVRATNPTGGAAMYCRLVRVRRDQQSSGL